MSVKLTTKVNRLLADPIGVLSLSVRTVNSLEQAGLHTVEDLLEACPRSAAACHKQCLCRQKCRRSADWKPAVHLLDVPNLSHRTIQEIDAVIRKKLKELSK